MDKTIDMFLDESCHTQNDGSNCMALVTVFTKKGNNNHFNVNIENLKNKHCVGGEIKWNKVSNSNIGFYLDLISFFSNAAEKKYFRIRALLVDYDKAKIYSNYSSWYYKMLYILFEKVINRDKHGYTNIERFNLYIDKKDNESHKESEKTAKYLQNKIYNTKKINGIAVDSKNYNLIQIADIFAGAMTYKKRGLLTSESKLKLINHIEDCFNIDLISDTYFTRQDFNLFVWTGKGK